MSRKTKAKPAAVAAHRPRADVSPWSGAEALKVDIGYAQLLIDIGQKPDPQWILDTLAAHLDDYRQKLEDELTDVQEAALDLYDDDDVADAKFELRQDIARGLREIKEACDADTPDHADCYRKTLNAVRDQLDKLIARLEDKPDDGPFATPKVLKFDPAKLAAKKK